MSTLFEEVAAKAMQLDPQEREMLIERLIGDSEELPPMSPEWQAEVSRRLTEIEEGTAQFLSHEEVMKRVRAKLQL